jgi:hypothetical protein
MASNEKIYLVNNLAVLAGLWGISHLVGSELLGLGITFLILLWTGLNGNGFVARWVAVWVGLFHRAAGTIR